MPQTTAYWSLQLNKCLKQLLIGHFNGYKSPEHQTENWLK